MNDGNTVLTSAYFSELLLTLINRNGSDLFLRSGEAPLLKFPSGHERFNGEFIPNGEIKTLLESLLTARQLSELIEFLELNFVYPLKNKGRFRINVFFQQGEMSLVARYISEEIPLLEELGLPETLKELIMAKRGLVLVVGRTGSGKSTTLASMIDYRNSTVHGHIITIEDPVEFLHTSKKSMINQREVGIDTLSYNDALQNALRQAPDLILIGEIRSQDTMEHAMNFAESGHLSLSTLHANNSSQALERIVNLFPEERRQRAIKEISQNLKAIISQRLVPSSVKGSQVAVCEIMIVNERISELIEETKYSEIREMITKGADYGMQTFDQDLLRLYKLGAISKDDAISNADSSNNIRLEIKSLEVQEKNSAKEVTYENFSIHSLSADDKEKSRFSIKD